MMQISQAPQKLSKSQTFYVTDSIRENQQTDQFFGQHNYIDFQSTTKIVKEPK